ncbi:uncharacterized protein FA14DRAFT_180363 [Meira miltonrushii]|uniref:Uncharacterized protein n=1 Tax=Meira miltonrushii TaxID=1280837 RepID=A0A316V7Y8_9BASI|nr:uncharacterized protein FA14DRAFT_180363 [Meira miltonrushii]PWN33727.1 hypothetical protein FA14DRAFT_180363 [Meira miltonrushii]
MRYNFNSILALASLAFACQSFATPVLIINKDEQGFSLYERSMSDTNDIQDDMPTLQKRVVITTPSPISFSSIGRITTPTTTRSRINKSVSTTTNTNTIRTNEAGSRTVTRTTSLNGGNFTPISLGPQRTVNTSNRRVTRTRTTSSTTTRNTNTASTTVTRNGRGTVNRLQSGTTLSSPTNLDLNVSI